MSQLLAQATDPAIQRARGLASTLGKIDVEALVDDYFEQVGTAPRRGLDGYAYFVPRTGAPTSRMNTTRREEQLAMALVNDRAFVMVKTVRVDLLMYAFPLYTRGGPKGIRAADLVGHSLEDERFWVVELKAAHSRRGDSPLRALYEVLTYGAVVEANSAHISKELMEEHGRAWNVPRPGLVVAAPTGYWSRWAPTMQTGDWWTEYHRLANELGERLATPVAVIDLGEVDFLPGPDTRPYVVGTVDARPVSY